MSRRILLIDDEADIREIAQVSLESSGWQVITAACAEEGLAKAAREMPDAILLDIMMPDVDGSAAFRRLRAHTETQRIPVILLTAKVQAADRRRFAALGVDGFIAKPFDPLTLADQICDALHWPRETAASL
jgi:CheY-like chemotaxis protein